jgi:putative DNA primase/helicase
LQSLWLLKLQKANHIGSAGYQPQFVPLFYGNALPTILGTDDGIWRRWIFLPWSHKITEDFRDRELGIKLARPAELAGIFLFALEGFRRYRKSGRLDIPSQITQMHKDYRNNPDSVQRWINSRCDVWYNGRNNPNDLTCEIGKMYKDYRDYTRNNFISWATEMPR